MARGRRFSQGAVALLLLVGACSAHAQMSMTICGVGTDYPVGFGGVVDVGGCSGSHATTQSTQVEPYVPPVGSGFGAIQVGTDGAVTVIVPVDPATKLPVPPGWSASGGGVVQPVAPATTSQTVNVTFCNNPNSGRNKSGSFGTGAGGVTACVAAISADMTADGADGGSLRNVVPNVGAGTYDADRHNAAGAFLWVAGGAFSTTSSCPSGYTVSGGTCNKTGTDSTIAKPTDAKCGVLRSGNTLSVDAQDGDCTGTLGGDQTVTVSGATTTITGPQGTVAVNVNATTGAVTVTGTYATGGNTTVKTIESQGGAGGAGTGATVGGGKVETYVGTGGSTSGTPNSTVNCEGCATEATQAQNKAILSEFNANGIKVNESGTPASVAGGAELSASIADVQAKFDSAKTSGVGALGVSGMGDLTVPSTHEQGTWLSGLFPAAASCAPVFFGSYRTGLTVDICPVLAVAMPLVEWMLYGLTMLYIYALFWRRTQGGGS